MATSKCIKCDSSSFEVKPASISGTRFKLYFVQCSRCGGVIGAMEYESNNYLSHQQSKLIEDISKRVKTIEANQR